MDASPGTLLRRRASRTLQSVLAIAEESLHARDLAARELTVVDPASSAEEALRRLDADNLDVAPLADHAIRRYVVRDELRLVSNGTSVDAVGHQLDITHLVTGNMGLAEALELLTDRGFLFILEGGRVSGIITLADVQRVPVSMVVLSMILAAEAGMNSLIEAWYPSEDAWLDRLGKRRLGLEERFGERVRRNAETSRIDLLMLEDRLRLVEPMRGVLGYRSNAAFRAWARRLGRTRDEVAHGGSVLDATDHQDPREALGIVRHVREFAIRVWDAPSEMTTT